MEDDQQFCLKWNNHQSTLIQNFDTLYESGTLVDCTLAAEGKYLKAHRVVLSACSPYFEGLLSEHYDKHPVFILKDVKFKELKAMMDYMYRGEVNISQDQLTALLKAAESLQIKGLSESKTGGGNNKTVSRVSKVAPQPRSSPLNISYASSGLTIERNRVPRQAQSSIGDLPEDSHSPQIPKELSSREGSQSPTSKKRRRLRRRSVGEDNSVENHEASNSSDIPQQMGVPALAIAPVADEKTNADPTDSLGRSALMTQLTKPADEMLQIPLENPEPNDNLIEPKSEYLEDQEESVEDLTLDDDMNDLNEIEQDTNRAGPSHDNSQHPAGLATWHVTGDRSNAGGVVGSVAGAPGTTDEVFLAAQEAAQAHRDSQGRPLAPYDSGILGILRANMDYRQNRNESRKNEDGRGGPYWQSGRMSYHCPRCNAGYTYKKTLKTHMKYDCGKEPRFKCPYCNKRDKYRRTYPRTMKLPPSLMLNKFVCHQCNAGYRRMGDLMRHKYNRDNQKLANLELIYGSLPYERSAVGSDLGYKYHYDQRKSFECLKCGTFFTQKTTITRHVRYFCGRGYRYQCPYCDTKASCSSNIYRHVRSRHKGLEAHAVKLFTSYEPHRTTNQYGNNIDGEQSQRFAI
ncbi:longitudinals lacking protein, isoforms A/B/D/L-like isoform X3 [Vespa velutina]|uniref:longitudinals lacking protein, isoforms A/B/D/L-like isoform X1 n=1 Tax=Vespa crabro TaxID=7445 RepID=UPI001EFF61B4|nr:longitudinals lacking protein, isoforms A/B/D/L-like isoform X1 [Vespa crabro]XP_046829718.1 longitudinals lacking protein, isoforms A/B/D/L-like isoform X1 [Vespa crabro]XP_046829719.1 longitudinals lacking protein, isoforms A/B/D/L-like isoform X1 [Vespa crabro]XP_047360922.1 longitudinals lacking protein, isoforms A/B/D/L-like isoform X3 [Vespa velutina]